MESAQKTKIMHIVTRMNTGGVAVLVDNLLTGMNQNEYEIILVTGICEEPEEEYLCEREVSYNVKRIPTFSKSISFKNDINAYLELRRIMQSFQPDIVHTHTSKAGLFGRVAAFFHFSKAKRIHTFHGHLLIGYFNPLKLSIVKLVEKALGIISSILIAMGTQVKDDLVNARIAPISKFKVLFPGITQPKFPSRSAAREQLELDDESIYCIFIGRLTQIKRPDRVLDVARNLKGLDPRVTILIVGEGELSPTLRDTAKRENLPVQFLGWRSDISVLLAAADLLLLTSDNEAVALTLIEASLAGIPVVTTSAGSVRDIAVDGFNGFVTGFNTDELTKAVYQLAKSAQLRAEMGANGATRAAELFSITTMVKAHEELYKELLRL